ncbi:uncharacterized protein LOC133730845 [Rosa rugosa]|uniref:uncharacterized protein LOC133730845 n=1 Tax=Rosa rugosa TaxID=74645 RepID=UPI002B409D07|nr:uncharacterized protein LOC133730845 [Rosa rugosa]
MPGPPGVSSSTDANASHVRLYRLQRGMTNAIIQDVSFSDDSNWILVSQLDRQFVGHLIQVHKCLISRAVFIWSPSYTSCLTIFGLTVFQQRRVAAMNSNISGQLLQRSVISENGRLSCTSSSNSPDTMTDRGAGLVEQHNGSEETGWGLLQMTTGSRDPLVGGIFIGVVSNVATRFLWCADILWFYWEGNSVNTMDGGTCNNNQILSHNRFDDDGRLKRTGTLWTASAHIITAVIGSGMLSLAWVIAQLGWIAGPIVMFLFSGVTYYTSTLLCACCRSGDTGQRNYTYMQAVQSTLGGAKVKTRVAQYLNLVGCAIGILDTHTIASSISMMAIKRSNCFHRSGGKDPCHINSNPYMIALGIMQIVLSQIPNFDQLWWLSIVAAAITTRKVVYHNITITTCSKYSLLHTVLHNE